jgi:hypothetical protein
VSCAASRLSPTRKKSSRGIVREDRADHEQSCASADDRERDPIDLAVKRKAHELDRMGEWVEFAHIVKQGTCFPHAPQWIERRRREELGPRLRRRRLALAE